MSAPESVSLTRRLFRSVAILAMLPAFLVVVNLTLLQNHDRWEWGRFTPARNLIEWVRAENSPEHVKPISADSTTPTVPDPKTTPVIPASAIAPPITPPLPTLPHVLKAKKKRSGSPFRIYFSQLGQNLEYVNLICLSVGFLVLRFRIFRREILPLSFVFAATLLAVWVRLIQIGNINGRYFLSAYFVSLPTIAAGVLHLMSLFEHFLQRTVSREPLRRVAFIVPIVGLIAAFWVDALTTRHDGRQRQVAIGNWIRENYGPFNNVVTDQHSARVGYVARRSVADVAYYDSNDISQDPPADLIILCPLPGQPPDAILVQHARKYELSLIPVTEFPPELTGYYVFRRQPSEKKSTIATPSAVQRR